MEDKAWFFADLSGSFEDCKSSLYSSQQSNSVTQRPLECCQPWFWSCLLSVPILFLRHFLRAAECIVTHQERAPPLWIVYWLSYFCWNITLSKYRDSSKKINRWVKTWLRWQFFFPQNVCQISNTVHPCPPRTQRQVFSPFVLIPPLPSTDQWD